MSAERRTQGARPEPKRAVTTTEEDQQRPAGAGSSIERDAKGRFAAGNRGGPGRPRGARSIVDAFRRRLQHGASFQELERIGKHLKLTAPQVRRLAQLPDRLEVLAEMLILKAEHGDLAALQEILDRLDPKLRRLEASGPAGGPIRIEAARYDLDEAEAEEIYRTEILGSGLGDGE